MAPKFEIATENNSEELGVGKTAGATTGPDPFDLDSLRLDPSFEETAGVAKVLSMVPVRKPNAQEWFRVHPSAAYRGNFSCIKLAEEGEFYLLTPAIARDFEQETIPMTIYTVINTNNVVLLWPCRITSADGRQNAWHSSAHEAAEKAMTQRVRIKANMGLGAYETFTTKSKTAEIDPAWPTESFSELVRLAFVKVGRYVSTPEHPVIKQLRGD
jgi:hypothetical protein